MEKGSDFDVWIDERILNPFPPNDQCVFAPGAYDFAPYLKLGVIESRTHRSRRIKT